MKKKSFAKKLIDCFKILFITLNFILMNFVYIYANTTNTKDAELFSLPIFRAMILILYVLILSLVSIFLFRYLYGFFSEKKEKTSAKGR